MTWPICSDYQEVIQHPKRCFQDPDLKEGQVRVDRYGLPQAITGNFAIVFQVTSPNGQRWAVKCFTREVPSLRERYQAISEHLQRVRLPCMVDFHYLDSGILVRGRWYPILKMHWVEGKPLNAFVRDCLNNHNGRETLQALTQLWLRLAQNLRDKNIGHGDLQHGNVLMVPGSEAPVVFLRLVDYDGMYVPALAQTTSTERGHPNYQHPKRLEQGYYGPDVDRFSHLVIYTALRCLMVDPTLWEPFNNEGDNLLFTKADFEQPKDSRLFRRLWELPEEDTRHLVGHLLLSAVRPITATPWLTELIRDGKVRPLSREDRTTVQHYLEPRPHYTPTSLSSDDFFLVMPGETSSSSSRPPSSRPSSRGLPSWLSQVAPSMAAPPPPPPPPPAARSSLKSSLSELLSHLWSRLQAVLRDPKRRRQILFGGGVAVAVLLAYEIGSWQTTHTTRHPTDAPRPDQTPSSNQPPTVAIAGTDPAEPVPGQPFTIRLDGNDPDGDTLTFEYRRVGENNWQAAPQGQVRLERVEPGVLELEFRAVDHRGAASALCHRKWQVSVEVRRFTGHTDGVTSVAISPDGRYALSGSRDKTLRLWEVATGKEIRQFTGHTGGVWSVAFSPDGRYALSGSEDKTLRLWEVATGQEIRQFTGHHVGVNSVAFSPDGRYALSGSEDQTLRLWDVKTGQQVRRFTEKTDKILCVAFSPDGRYALSGSYDQFDKKHILRLWEVATGKEIRRFTGHTSGVESVAFSPDGRYALSGSSDKTLRLWALPEEVWLKK